MHFSRLLITTASAACLLAYPASAQTPPQTPAIAAPTSTAPTPNKNPGRPVTREELPALIKETLMNQPEIIMEAVQKLRDKQMEEAKQKAQEGLKQHSDALFKDPSSPSVGNPNADVTVVEFFDYHCGYCKHMLPAIAQLLKEDKNVRVVFKEFPILSEDSVTASRAALAVNRIAKDKYFDFHQALMKASGKFDDKVVADLAKKHGIDAAKLKTEMAKPEITAILDKNREIATALSITGTPAIIVGNEIMPGAISYEDLKKVVDAAHSGGKAPEPAAAPAETSKPAADVKPAEEAKPAAPAAAKPADAKPAAEAPKAPEPAAPAMPAVPAAPAASPAPKN